MKMLIFIIVVQNDISDYQFYKHFSFEIIAKNLFLTHNKLLH